MRARNLLVIAAGVAVGLVVARQLTRAARTTSPANLVGAGRDSALGILGTVRDFIADVRDGMAEKEAEIHAAFEDGVALDDDLHYPLSEEDEEDTDLRTPGAART